MLDPQGHSEKVARNREWSTNHLRKHGIPFNAYNNGAHLVILSPFKVDFWPGTGKYIFRQGKRHGRGIKNLLRDLINQHHDEELDAIESDADREMYGDQADVQDFLGLDDIGNHD